MQADRQSDDFADTQELAVVMNQGEFTHITRTISAFVFVTPDMSVNFTRLTFSVLGYCFDSP